MWVRRVSEIPRELIDLMVVLYGLHIAVRVKGYRDDAPGEICVLPHDNAAVGINPGRLADQRSDIIFRR